MKMYQTSHTKINNKRVKNLNPQRDAINLLRENIRETTQHADVEKEFLDKSPESGQIKTKFDKWDYIQL